MSGMTVPGTKSQQPRPVPRAQGSRIFGQLGEIRKGPLVALSNMSREYGDLVEYSIFTFHSILVSYPDGIKHILQENNRNYDKQNFNYRMLKPVVGEGLLTSDGDFWLRQRRLIQPAFHRRRISGFGRLMTATAGETLQRWQAPAREGSTLDVAEEMMRLTLAIVGKALFSQDLTGDADRVGQAFTFVNQSIAERFRRVFAPPLNWPTPKNRRFNTALSELNSVVDEIIHARRRSLDAGEAGEPDLLTLLLLARDEETGQGMTDRQLRDEVMTLLLAGHETTANALAWTFCLLSANPESRERLETELDQVLGGRLPNLEDLPALPYNLRVIQEAMRLYPPAWIVSRRAIQDDELLGYRIPANSILALSPYVMHRHPAYWEDPQRFDPDRFLPEKVEARPQYAYFPFGGGPRLCIGRDFAMMEAQLLLASIAQQVRLDLVPGHSVETEPMITLRPKGGLPMTACLR